MLDFSFECYSQFCEANEYKPSNYQSLSKFEKFCRNVGIKTKPLKRQR